MTRSIGRRHRVGMLAAAGVALVAVGLASGCSAGQVAETARIVPSVPGGSVQVKFGDTDNPNSLVAVENATIVYASGGYPAGATAPLSMRIINQTPGEVTVTPIAATLQAPTGTTPGNDKSIGTLAWASSKVVLSPTPSAVPSATPSAPASGAPSGAPSAPVTPTPTPTLSDLKIPTGSAGLLILAPTEGQFLVISNLAQPLSPGDVVNVTLTFSDASGKRESGTVAVPVALPTVAASRSAQGG